MKPEHKLYDIINKDNDHDSHVDAIWGWSDKDMKEEEKNDALVYCKSSE